MRRGDLLRELVVLVRLLYPRTIVKNPRRKLLERATRNHPHLAQLAEDLAETIAKLNGCHRLRKGITVIETSREDNLNALALLVEQINPEAFWYKGIIETYQNIQWHFPDQPFSQSQLRKRSGIPKTTVHHHVKTMLHYGILERIGGSKHKGHTYRLK